jgi:hypothetical protein
MTTNGGRPLPWHETATARSLLLLKDSGAVTGAAPREWMDALLSRPPLVRVTTAHGYVIVRIGKGHVLADRRGYAYEHRVVGSILHGARLPREMQVHHRDGDKTHNAPSNLEILTQAMHSAEHRKRDDLRQPGESNPQASCACGCGETFPRYDAENRPRAFVSGHNSRPVHRTRLCASCVAADNSERQASLFSEAT